MYQLNDLMDQFQSLDAEVLGISTEHVPSLIKYSVSPRDVAGLDHMKVRLISDPLAEVLTKFGVLKKEENLAFTSVAIIDKDMTLISKESYDFPLGCNFLEILATLKEFDSCKEKLGKFCEIETFCK